MRSRPRPGGLFLAENYISEIFERLPGSWPRTVPEGKGEGVMEERETKREREESDQIVEICRQCTQQRMCTSS